MRLILFIEIGSMFMPVVAMGCGLDWTLPTGHFEAVEEHGYVAYWEKIGQVDLGDRLIIPVNLGFNSHQEINSPTCGKGWTMALLESHVEPIDENSMRVVMPDGWKFLFYRNGNTETWRGNAGWVGETSHTIFTIAAPCGTRIRFDGGKIQEIDTDKNKTLTYRYNGGVAMEVDEGGTALVQVESDPQTGLPAGLLIGSQKVEISLGRRPQVINRLGQNLITGFDPSLGRLRWPDGDTETFTFGTDANLVPTLDITRTEGAEHDFTWDPETGKIKSDEDWTYNLKDMGDHLKVTRTLSTGHSESYEDDERQGVTIDKGLDGNEIATHYFVAGLLKGRIRKVEQLQNGLPTTLYSVSYFPSGKVMRETLYPDTVRQYSASGKLLKETVGDVVTYEQEYDDQNRLVHRLNQAQEMEVKKTFSPQGGEMTQVYKQGTLFYTEQVDNNNNLISFNIGNP